MLFIYPSIKSAMHYAPYLLLIVALTDVFIKAACVVVLMLPQSEELYTL